MNKFYTTMPIKGLGDDMRVLAPLRAVEILAWDGSYLSVGVVNGVQSIIICSMIYQTDRGPSGLKITLKQLLSLPKTTNYKQPEIFVPVKQKVEQVQYRRAM